MEYKSIQEIAEVLKAIALLEYHNKNYLTNNLKFLTEEKIRLTTLIIDMEKNRI